MSLFAIILLISIFILPLVLVLYKPDNTIGGNLDQYMICIFLELFVIGAGILLLVVIDELFSKPDYIKKIEERELVSFGNNSSIKGEINGSVILGCGGIYSNIDNEQYYFYYTQEKDGLKFNKVLLNNKKYEVYLSTYDTYNESKPTIVYYKRANKRINLLDKVFVKRDKIIELYDESNLKYEVYKIIFNIPENSIIYTNSIDMNKF